MTTALSTILNYPTPALEDHVQQCNDELKKRSSKIEEDYEAIQLLLKEQKEYHASLKQALKDKRKEIEEDHSEAPNQQLVEHYDLLNEALAASRERRNSLQTREQELDTKLKGVADYDETPPEPQAAPAKETAKQKRERELNAMSPADRLDAEKADEDKKAEASRKRKEKYEENKRKIEEFDTELASRTEPLESKIDELKKSRKRLKMTLETSKQQHLKTEEKLSSQAKMVDDFLSTLDDSEQILAAFENWKAEHKIEDETEEEEEEVVD
jgi:chromosome segregation ATPase